MSNNGKRPAQAKKFILWFEDIGMDNLPQVGGKSASLGEMYRKLTLYGIKVPNGFAVTIDGYYRFMRTAGIEGKIKKILTGLDTHNIKDLRRRGRRIRELVCKQEIPKDLEEAIVINYRKLERQYGRNVDVAVRSSGTAEDLPGASFAGQHDTYLNIRGKDDLLHACRRCFASLFTDRAISYREDKKFDHFSIGLSVAIQKMVRSDIASSGVMFSIDTESGHKDMVLINSAYGLGEGVVQGAVNPDEFYVHKPTLKKNHRSIVSKTLGTKRTKMVYATGRKQIKYVPVKVSEQKRFSITDDEILQLARWAVIIEEHYSREAKKFRPMDMEWAKDGETGELFILQARPETVISQRNGNILEQYHLLKKGRLLVSGIPVGIKIGHGRANVIKDVKHATEFHKGDILVTHMTDPDWEPYMKIASAIVTNEGGRTSHAAIISRELGIPAIVGADRATTKIKHGQQITVSCAEGEIAHVYAGKLPFRVEKTNLEKIDRPEKTEIKMIFGTPEMAFHASQIPNDGVGLAREEFIISSYIKIHPMALVKYPRLKDKESKKEINRLTRGYDDKKEYYVDKLAYGIATIASAFYPKEVIVRLADFRSNEYAELVGGREFEPTERNPMIGWRGASRYYDPSYRPAFDLECKALKKVRYDMGLDNIHVMVPFCRTVDEGKKVIKAMAENGLHQKTNGMEIYMMCEIPSNVILSDLFAEIFDGFSIGSNDLTQLTLGLDRDSGLVAHVGDENNEAVKRMIADVIRVAKKHKRKIGICGQAPSDFPDFAKFLLDLGIDSISLNPDAILKTTVELAKM
jgi:pyruvate,water dikinase